VILGIQALPGRKVYKVSKVSPARQGKTECKGRKAWMADMVKPDRLDPRAQQVE